MHYVVKNTAMNCKPLLASMGMTFNLPNFQLSFNFLLLILSLWVNKKSVFQGDC